MEYSIGFDPPLTSPITEDSPAAFITLVKLLNLAHNADFLSVLDEQDFNPVTVN